MRDAHEPSRATSERIDWVLEAAHLILAGEGPKGLTIKRLADRAGVSVGSIYRHFEGKEAIVAALLRREAGLALARFDGLEEHPPPGTLREILELFLQESIDQHLRVLRLHPEYVCDHIDEVSIITAVPGGRERMRHLIEHVLLEHRSELRQTIDLPAALFVLNEGVTAMIQSACRDSPELLAAPSFASALVDMLCRLLMPPPEETG